MDDVVLGVIADIHGNRLALEAVLADLARHGVARVVHLGDSLGGPLDPAGTADLLAERGIVGVRGNDDRALLEPGNAGAPTWDYVTPRLAARHWAWLRALPPTLDLAEGVLLCHGTPRSDETALLEVPTAEGGVLRPAIELAAELAGVAQPVVLCGHSHVPRVVAVPGGKLVVNPGSVGVPAYTADVPVPHKMESGSPHARYAILARRAGAWSVTQCAVPYAWDAAADLARANGRPDWAAWLATGRA